MPSISSAGLGSGLDVRSLVDQLVAAEGAPIQSRLDRKEIDIQQGLTAIGSFKGALLDFQSSLAPLRKADAFRSINATSSNEEIFTVSAENNAIAGSYDVEISQLAQSQKLKSESFKSEFDAIGSGKISIEFGTLNPISGSFDVNADEPLRQIDIATENNSLRGIQETINQADIGVRASVVNDGSGYLLILNSQRTGVENSLRISVTDADGNDNDRTGLSMLAYNPAAVDIYGNFIGSNLEETAAAKDAIFSLNGISISNSQNEIKDSIPGVTLTLKKLTDNTVESLSIEKNVSGVKQSIQNFVNSYNELMNTVSALTGFDSESGQSGPLSGDASIRGIIDHIRRRLSTSFNGINENLSSLSSIGINSRLDGSLSLDESRLERSLENHIDEITHLFSAAISTSDPNISVSSEKLPTINGVFDITIEQTPSRGFLTGGFTANFPFMITNDMGRLSLSVDNIIAGNLKIPARVYNSGNELATELQRVINADAALKRSNVATTVNYNNNTFEIGSNTVSADSAISITSIGGALSELTGLSIGKGNQGSDVKGNVNGKNITGTGSKLKLEDELKGVVLDISGKQTGNRGVLVVTNGIAAILDELTESFLVDNGLLDSRIEGYNSRIKDIERQRLDLVRRLEVSEERYLKQFTNLDAMLGKMRSTSNFLAEKLSPASGKR